MIKRSWTLAVCLTLLALPGASVADPGPKEWSRVSFPSHGNSQSIGGAAAGCLSGGVKLPEDGVGYQILRPQRNRMWGHPSTIDFVQSLGGQARQAGLSAFLVGDLSQPRGGPMAYGHGSHQNGLDVDIWFVLPSKPWGRKQLSHPVGVSMVSGTGINPKTWGASQMTLLRLAAQSPQVDRIFVNPPIKAEACRTATGDRRWLAKLRPWWGHDEHFHVRLGCVPGDLLCQSQAAVPAGDGCGSDLDGWLQSDKRLPNTGKDKPNTRRPVLPEACQMVFQGREVRKAEIPPLANPVITSYIPAH